MFQSTQRSIGRVGHRIQTVVGGLHGQESRPLNLFGFNAIQRDEHGLCSTKAGLNGYVTMYRLAMLYALPVQSTIFRTPTIRAFGAANAQFRTDVDYYAHLGLAKSATPADIKKQFYDLAKKHHPDAVGACPKSEEKFKQITAAYEVLGNDATRRQYDSARHAATEEGTFTRDPFSGRPRGSPGFGYQGGAADDWDNFTRQHGQRERTYSFHGKNGQGFAGYRGHG